MNKLLNKTLLYYTMSALLMLLISAPLYYFLSEKLYVDDVDEAISLRENEFKTISLQILDESEIREWNQYNRDIHILPDTVTHIKEQIFQQEFYDTLGDEWEPYRLLYSDVTIEGKPYVLMIRQNLVESADIMRTTGLFYLIIFIVMMVGFVVISRIVSQRLWKPFYHTLDNIESFNLEHHQLPVFPQDVRTTEFVQLNKAVEQLMKQNLQAYRAQKEFTENAAHELQTPLSVFQTKLDLLIQDPSITAEQASIIQHLYESVSRLSRLNKNLLLLTKISNGQYPETEHVSLSELLEQVLPYFKEQAQEKDLDIQVHIKEDFQVKANKGLIEILINNLLLNAVKHNIDKGSVMVELKESSLIVSNTGIPEPLQPEKLFKRFAKSASNSRSTGLGLAIVKKIADLNGWTVKYAYKEEFHVFSVLF